VHFFLYDYFCCFLDVQKLKLSLFLSKGPENYENKYGFDRTFWKKCPKKDSSVLSSNFSSPKARDVKARNEKNKKHTNLFLFKQEKLFNSSRN
jgi:hypothetical protein